MAKKQKVLQMKYEGMGRLNVLMFGWEFPPIKSGGLGTACYGLTKGLARQGLDISFVIPHRYEQHDAEFVALEGLFDRYHEQYEHISTVVAVNTLIRPYQSEGSYQVSYHREAGQVLKRGVCEKEHPIYSNNLYQEVERYAQLAALVAKEKNYDLIHAHDWMTYRAGIIAKNTIHKPLIIHVHATEYDRTGGHPNPHIHAIELEGMHAADLIITVSQFTKDMVVRHYGIDSNKIKVVHNAVDQVPQQFQDDEVKFKPSDKVVLFLGRVTIQKGPDYFVKAAAKVKELEPDAKFIIAGSGDMEAQLIREASAMGLGKDVLFTGFLQGRQVDRIFQMADVYVMPSVSEPFGITPLESLLNGTPVIISKQSGVSEVLRHCLKVDFWDIDQLTNQIVAVLRHKATLGDEMAINGAREVQQLTWDKVGEQVNLIYREMVA